MDKSIAQRKQKYSVSNDNNKWEIEKLKDEINIIVKAHSFNGDTLPTPEILEITKQDDYNSELLVFNGFINDKKKLWKRLND